MENKSPHHSDFEKFVRKSLQKTNDTPDDNTWANIAVQQSRRNTWLRFRHYGIRIAPVLVMIVLALAGRQYFAGNTAPASETGFEKNLPQQPAPAQQPQVNATELLPDLQAPVAPKPGAAVNKRGIARHINTAPSATVRFLAGEGLRYENPATGTEVHIPANVLVDARGRLVSGEVEFELREYRSATDFLTSGIPMHYADERGAFFFNSGGMFDVRVNQHGEPLQMASGQACDVRFTSTHKLTQPSLYYFDEADNAWRYEPAPAFASNEIMPQLPPIVTEGTAVRDNRGLRVACLPNESIAPQGKWAQPYEDEAAAWLKDAVETGYDYAFGKKTMPGWFRKHSNWTNEQLLSGMEHSLVRLKRHKDTDDMFFPEDVNNVFTELKAFKDCYFIINEGLGSKKSFTKEEFDSYWDRVSVVQQNGAICYVSFFGKQGLLQFYATLIGSRENSNFDVEKVMAEYTHLRNQRQQNFEKQANAWRHFLFTAQMFQEQEEWCMDANTWLDYFEANPPTMRKRYAALKEQGIADDKTLAMNTWKNWNKRVRNIYFDNYKSKNSFDRSMTRTEGMTYALRVTNFGLYNCDQIYTLGRGTPLGRGQEVMLVLAAYKSADGRQVVPKTVSMIERNSRLYFTMPKAEQMVYVPGRRFDIIVTDTNGRFYRLTGDQYAGLDLDNEKSYTFTVEDVTAKTLTPRDWADLLEI